jgi:hypothetical protein
MLRCCSARRRCFWKVRQQLVEHVCLCVCVCACVRARVCVEDSQCHCQGLSVGRAHSFSNHDAALGARCHSLTCAGNCVTGAASQRGRAAASSEPCDTRAPGLSATSTPELRRDPAGFCRARTSSRGLEEVEEVVSVSVGKVVVEETMSLQQSRSSNYVHVQSLGVRCDVGCLTFP